jgi:hypothetical protein
MANTKSMSREERKTAKRGQRKELTKLYGTMTNEQRKKFRKSEEKIGFKAFLVADKAEKAAKAAGDS